MHPQTVLKNTKIVRKALKWLWFFPQLCLFCLCVCSVVTLGAWRGQIIHILSKPFLCVPHGVTHRVPHWHSSKAALPWRGGVQLSALPGSLVRSRQENAALCGVFFFLWNPAASQTCISRFLATHVNAEPFPSIL